MSNTNYSNCKSENRESCYECKCCCEYDRPQYLPPNRTLLRCGCPGAVTLPLAIVAGTNFAVASVNVDTRGLRKPCVKFEFANNIVTTAGVLTLNLRIFKQCKNQLVPIPVGPVWMFSRLVAVTESNAFTFFVCDCDIREEECCNYSVATIVVDVATAGITSINNVALSAIVVDNRCDCK